MNDDKSNNQVTPEEEELIEPSAASVEPVEPEEPPVTPEVIEPEEEEPVEKPVSPRENRRIQELTEKLAKARELQTPQNNPSSAPFKEREEGYQLDEANRIANDYGQQRFNEGLETTKALEFKFNLRIDAPKVAQKYDIMNSDSDEYDPGRTSFINELYLRTVGYDPNNGNVKDASIGYEEFVDGIMAAVDKQAAAASADTAVNLAKQSSQLGTRPTGESKKAYSGDDPKQMSDAQLEDKIAQAMGGKK